MFGEIFWKPVKTQAANEKDAQGHGSNKRNLEGADEASKNASKQTKDAREHSAVAETTGKSKDFHAAAAANAKAESMHTAAMHANNKAGLKTVAENHKDMADMHAEKADMQTKAAQKADPDRHEMVHDAKKDLQAGGIKSPSSAQVKQHVADNHGVQMSKEEVEHHLSK